MSVKILFRKIYDLCDVETLEKVLRPGTGFVLNEEVTLHELPGLTTHDLLWLLPHATLTDAQIKAIAVDFSLACARRSLPLFEREYPQDDRASKLVECAEKYVADGTPVSTFAVLWGAGWSPRQETHEELSLASNAMMAAQCCAQCCATVSGRTACTHTRAVLWAASWRSADGWTGDTPFTTWARDTLRQQLKQGGK